MHQFENQTQFARRLRRKSTLAEKVMWILLRDRELAGFKFRRQHPIGVYTVDFVCIAHSLIVECDGITHDNRAAYDRARDLFASANEPTGNLFLAAPGYRVLRFKDEAVHGNPDRVAAQVLAALRSDLARRIC
jgi:very-short-patch-repair endonuclease